MGHCTHRGLAWIEEELRSLQNKGLRRRRVVRQTPMLPEIEIQGSRLIHFGSNDYLGLAADPRLKAAAVAALDGFGWGSGASPLILGHCGLHERLEERLAQFEATEAAVVFSSGFAANAGVVPALVGVGDVVCSDRNNHASLVDGCRLSRADVRVYDHADANALRRLLDRPAHHRRRLIVTDGLFSMDGDLAPLAELAGLAERYEAMLLVDEAHATGVFGGCGRGAGEYLGVEDRVAVRVGTLSKALGGIGGFVAGSRTLIDWLVNRSRPYVYSTASPAAAAAAALAAIQIVEEEPQRRTMLLNRAAGLRARLAQQGWNTGRSASQIIPIVVGEPQRAVAMAAALRQRGLFVPAIRPPTVPEGQACLRISLTHAHTPEMVDLLLGALETLR